MLAKPLAILACLLLTGICAGAQSAAPGAGPGAVAPSSVRQKPAGPQRPPSAQSQPNVSKLTKQECKKLGGTLQDDTKCKNAQRCVITLASGDVNSICIDEVKGESKK